jgi:thiamine biosynthesis lipoprotein
LQEKVQSLVHTLQFAAMGSPCEVQVDCADAALAARLGAIARAEAQRIEAKFSRYRAGSVVGRINAGVGAAFRPDAETALLLDYAAQCHALSGGLFDITSGILRRARVFDGSARVPDTAQVAALLPLIGWEKARWAGGELTLRPGMEMTWAGWARNMRWTARWG